MNRALQAQILFVLLSALLIQSPVYGEGSGGKEDELRATPSTTGGTPIASPTEYSQGSSTNPSSSNTTAAPPTKALTPDQIKQKESLVKQMEENQSQARTASVQHFVMGAGLLLTCKTTWPAGAPACAMGALQVYQGIKALEVAKNKDLQKAIDDLYANGQDVGNGDVAAAKALNKVETDKLTTQALGLTEKLAAMGFKVDSTGLVTLPNGQKVPVSSLGTAGGLAAAGFDSSKFSSELEKMKALDEKLAQGGKSTASAGAVAQKASSGGAAGARARGGAGIDDMGMGASLGSDSSDEWQVRNMASVVGLKRKIGKDTIGVSSDNLFEMIRRRYDNKRKANTFMEQK